MWASNYSEELENHNCYNNLQKFVPDHLKKQAWVPVMISAPGQQVTAGIAFRNTKVRKAYKIWADKAKSYFSELDLNLKEESITVFDSKNSCEQLKSRRSIEWPVQPADGYSDADLQKTISSNKAGLIYIWSPYMPLSIDALKEIKRAANAKKLALTILMDGKANDADAKKWVDLKEVKQDETKKVAANELWVREIQLHYPALLIYKDGFISNRTYIGHKKSNIYQKWIDLEMSNMEREMK